MNYMIILFNNQNQNVDTFELTELKILSNHSVVMLKSIAVIQYVLPFFDLQSILMMVVLHTTKGRLISKGLFGVFKSTKKK